MKSVIIFFIIFLLSLVYRETIGKNKLKQEENMYKVEKPNIGNPDKGKNGQQSGTGKNEYRGNDYKAIQDKIEREDQSKLKRQDYKN